MSSISRRWIAPVLAAAAFGAALVGIALLVARSDGSQTEDRASAAKPPATAERGALEEPVRPEAAPAPSIAGAPGRDENGDAEPASRGGADPRELPIEEVLAAAEEPRAVFYMSRIREALREGNPAFAEELLRQMREQHASSVLVDEAALLIEESRSNPGRWQP